MHNHVENHSSDILLMEARHTLNEAVQNPTCNRKNAYQVELAKIPENLRHYFGTYKSLKSSLRTLAVKAFPKCKNLVELDLLLKQNQKIKETLGQIDGKRFYRRRFHDGRHDAVLFLNPVAVSKATITDMLLVDGTFRTTPLKCAQTLVIYRVVGGAVSHYKIEKSSVILIMEPFSLGFLASR